MKFSIIIFPFLLVGSKAMSQVNEAKLHAIVEKGKQTNSDAIIFYKDNKLLVEEYYNHKNKPEYIASAGKSLVSLAIGKLIDDGKIKSLDEPVYDFYPEWKQGTKKDITVKMLLNHTSGLQNNANAMLELEPPPLYHAVDIIKLALCAEVSSKPNTVFNYNNKAVALLGGVIEKASGLPFDKYFIENFYKPMDITSYEWLRDEAGNATAHGAFIIKPMDFAKFGLLLLNKGIYNGKQIISSKWAEQSYEAGQSFDLRCGYLWWRVLKSDKRVISPKTISILENNKVNPEIIAKLKPMLNDTLTPEQFTQAISKRLGADWSNQINQALSEKDLPLTAYYSVASQSKDAIAYYADGYRGNYLVIVPSLNIVAVRVRGRDNDYNPETDNFSDFVKMVAAMVEKDK